MLSPSFEVLSYPNYATHLTNTQANILPGDQESYSLNILPDKQGILFENNVALLEETLDEIWQTPKIVHTVFNDVTDIPMRIKKSSSVGKPKYIDKVSNRLVVIPNKNNPPSNFFVPVHPVIALLVPYGLLLTFSAALFPENIPTIVPLGELARYLGNEFSVLMQFLALFAASVHAAYPFYILTLSKKYQLRLKQTFFWTMNGFFFGIFAIWPLVFYDFYVENEAMYCNIPLAMC